MQLGGPLPRGAAPTARRRRAALWVLHLLVQASYVSVGGQHPGGASTCCMPAVSTPPCPPPQLPGLAASGDQPEIKEISFPPTAEYRPATTDAEMEHLYK
jgi:hypothetical protein